MCCVVGARPVQSLLLSEAQASWGIAPACCQPCPSAVLVLQCDAAVALHALVPKHGIGAALGSQV